MIDGYSVAHYTKKKHMEPMNILMLPALVNCRTIQQNLINDYDL